MLQMNTYLTVRRSSNSSRAPMNRPVSASPAYANPSVKYEKISSNCIMIVEHASSTSPNEAAITVYPI